jgi:hypothetical protein
MCNTFKYFFLSSDRQQSCTFLHYVVQISLDSNFCLPSKSVSVYREYHKPFANKRINADLIISLILDKMSIITGEQQQHKIQ